MALHVHTPRPAPQPSARWMRDEKVEQHLDGVRADWVYLPAIPITHIDLARSRQNNSRLTTHGGGEVELREHTVERYAAAMRAGTRFPALVAYRDGRNGPFVLMGGNHRVESARRAGLTAVDLYLVRDPNDAQRYLVTATLNTLEGDPSPRAEQLDHALTYLARYGTGRDAVALAAGLFGFTEKELNRERRYRELVARLHDSNVDTSGWTRDAIEKVASIDNMYAMAAVARLHGEAQLRTDALRDLVNAVRAAPTEAAQLAVVAEHQKRGDTQLRIAARQKGARVVPTQPRRTMMGALRTAERLAHQGSSLFQLGVIGADDVAQALTLARSLVARLEVLSAPRR